MFTNLIYKLWKQTVNNGRNNIVKKLYSASFGDDT